MGIIDTEDQFSAYMHVASRLIVDGRMEGYPRLSIMIPTYQRPEFLKEAVRSALEQVTDVSYEVVVVDNDTSMAAEVDRIVSEFDDERIRLFRNAENIGMFGNWNRCIELARGEWVSILSDDDILHRNFIAMMLGVIEKDASIDLLFCRSELMDLRGTRLDRLKSRVRQKLKTINKCLLCRRVERINVLSLYISPDLCSSLGMVFRRDHAMELGGFKPGAFPIADYVFFVMYHLRFGACRLNKCLAYYRVHENETANPVTGEGFIAKNMELRRALERHIAAPLPLLRLYSQLCALTFIRIYNRFWGTDLDFERVRKTYGLPRLPAMTSYYVVKSALRTCFAFATMFKRR